MSAGVIQDVMISVFGSFRQIMRRFPSTYRHIYHPLLSTSHPACTEQRRFPVWRKVLTTSPQSYSLWDTCSFFVHRALRGCITLLGSKFPPLRSNLIVLRNTVSSAIHKSQIKLGVDIPLFSKRFPFTQSSCEINFCMRLDPFGNQHSHSSALQRGIVRVGMS